MDLASPIAGIATPAATDLSLRACGTCTLCCRLPDIEVLSKPANAWCRHCVEDRGCRIYDDRPQTCRDFLCLWRTDAGLGPEWDPSSAKMMLYRQGPQTTVLVDPAHPEIWRTEPYRSGLAAIAAEAEAGGGYVILFVGDHVSRVRPDAGGDRA